MWPEISTKSINLLLLLLSLWCLVNGDVIDQHKHRTKRKVLFRRDSKFFFRLNGKDNVLNFTDIFAHGYGVRVNFDLPSTIPKRHSFFKRDAHSHLDQMSDVPGLEMYSCILKYLCDHVEALGTDEKCGMLCGIGNIIARSKGVEAGFFKSFLSQCPYHISNCPYAHNNDGRGGHLKYGARAGIPLSCTNQAAIQDAWVKTWLPASQAPNINHFLIKQDNLYTL